MQPNFNELEGKHKLRELSLEESDEYEKYSKTRRLSKRPSLKKSIKVGL